MGGKVKLTPFPPPTLALISTPSNAWERHKYTRAHTNTYNAWEPWTMSLSEQRHLCTSSQAPLLLSGKADIPLTQYSHETSQLFVRAPQNHLHNPLQDPQANPWHRSVIIQHRNQLHFWREGWKKNDFAGLPQIAEAVLWLSYGLKPGSASQLNFQLCSHHNLQQTVCNLWQLPLLTSPFKNFR